MGYFSSQNWESLACPNVAYERAYQLCEQAVLLERSLKGSYKGEAIQSLSRAGEFGSWLRKLFHREKVTIHLHYYERLMVIVSDLVERDRKKNEHIEELLRIAKGQRDGVGKDRRSLNRRADSVDA